MNGCELDCWAPCIWHHSIISLLIWKCLDRQLLLFDPLMLLFFFVLNQKEQLKVLLSAKEREDGARGPETVKVQLRSTLVSDCIDIGSLIWGFNTDWFVF